MKRVLKMIGGACAACRALNGKRRRTGALALVAIASIGLSGVQVAAPTASAVPLDGTPRSAEPAGTEPSTGPGPLETLSREEAEAAGMVPPAVPEAGADEVVISVRIGGDRLPGGGMSDVQAAGVAGAKLYLGTGGNGVAYTNWGLPPYDYPWATCTSDENGDCNFIVPIAQRTGAAGMSQSAKPTIQQLSTDAVGTPGWRMAVEPMASTLLLPYAHKLDVTVNPGTTYRSTEYSPMLKFQEDATADLFTDPFASRQVLASSGRWMVVRDNPPMPSGCGLDVAVVMDLSGSIGSELPRAIIALDTLVDAYVGTPSSVSLFNFNTVSPALQADGTRLSNHPELIPVRTAPEANAVKDIYRSWSLEGSTNWDQALQRVADAPSTYDVAVLITDGMPTIHSDGEWPAAALSRWVYGNTRSYEAAVFSANALKSKGTRIVPFYVGPAVADNGAKNNLRNLSGMTEGTDFHIADDYAEAARQLAGFAKENCESSVRVEKRVVDPSFDATGATKEQLDANSVPAEGWTFDAGTTSAASIPAASTTFTTEADGRLTVPLKFENSATRTALSIAEQQQEGYEVVPVDDRNAHCASASTNDAMPVTDYDPATGPGFTVEVSAGDALDCVIYNQAPAAAPDPATITLTKRVLDVEGNSEQPGAGWTLGAEVASVAGATAAAAPAAGTQTTPASGEVDWAVEFGRSADRADVRVSEAQQPGWSFMSGNCTVTPAAGPARTEILMSAAGTTLSGIAPGDAVECVFLNRPRAGSVAWQKTSGGEHLRGSSWELTGPGSPGGELVIDDCTSAPCTGPDGDARAGHLQVTGLAWGSYSLVETRAPSGFVIDPVPRTFTVGGVSPARIDWDLGQIENAQQQVPEIPLTGGIGRDLLLIASGILLLAAIVLAAGRVRKPAPVGRRGRRGPGETRAA